MSDDSSATVLAHDDVGAGVPLVLLHGFPLTRHLWDAQLGRDREVLIPICRVITPDLRGFGESASLARDDAPLTMARHADDVVALLDALGIDRAIVGGVSMGGYVTLALWHRHPDRVLALVLADTRAAADTEQARARRAAVIALARAEGALAVADAQVTGALGATTRRTHPALVHRVRDMMATVSVRTMIAAQEGMLARDDATAWLGDIDVPTLLVVGDEDAITPVKEMRAMRERIAGSTLVVIEQSGHLSPVEQPERFDAAVAEFVRRVAAPAGAEQGAAPSPSSSRR
jgi:pimeloyl-ACP methyl ester carboxylesterase